MKHFRLSIILFLIVLTVSSCSGEDQEETAVMHQIIVLFSPGGLGDRGYNDLILKGLQKVRVKRQDVQLLFHSPSSEAEAERIFDDWLKLKSKGLPCLFVLASNDYVAMTERLLAETPITSRYKDVLLFEVGKEQQLPVSTFKISMYGTSYMAGAFAAFCPGNKALVMLGNSNDNTIRHAANGFIDGYADNGKVADVASLADDWHGYMMENDAYRKMYDWAKDYDFVYPVAGGSNMGIYRYLREYPNGVYTAGMDTDQSALCTQVIGSVVKHIDLLIEDYITDWLETGEMPQYKQFGLESGYVDWILSPDYKNVFDAYMEDVRETAIRKERNYHEIND